VAEGIDAGAVAGRGARPSGQMARALAGRSAPKQLPATRGVNRFLWPAAGLLGVVAVVLTVLVAMGTGFTPARRAGAAVDALLLVAALAVLAQAILLWYQERLIDVPADAASATGVTSSAAAAGSGAAGGATSQQTIGFRRRGLKAAIIGQDGRASTSKTQVVLWTGAVVWALLDLLVLARAYPGGNLFTSAVTTSWRPEYLVLRGLPVAAATTAKAVVVRSNAGLGPVTLPKGAGPAEAAAAVQAVQASVGADRVYMRKDPAGGRWGFLTGVAELITSDDGSVAWADLQYVVFTLITLAYFAVQVISQPRSGLPQVPAALLTLMGVSATAYTANKIVNTQGVPAAKVAALAAADPGRQAPASAQQAPASAQQAPASAQQAPASAQQPPDVSQQGPAVPQQVPASGQQVPAVSQQGPAGGQAGSA